MITASGSQPGRRELHPASHRSYLSAARQSACGHQPGCHGTELAADLSCDSLSRLNLLPRHTIRTAKRNGNVHFWQFPAGARGLRLGLGRSSALRLHASWHQTLCTATGRAAAHLTTSRWDDRAA